MRKRTFLRSTWAPFASFARAIRRPGIVIGIVLAASTTSADPQRPVSVTAAMECSRGPNAEYTAAVTMPRSATTGSYVRIRIDGAPSGRISHSGLNYIHEMRMDYLLPAGATYVTDSLHVVPGTGTANARDGAHVWRDAAGIHTQLPARIDNGDSFTPPSVELDVRVDAPAGTVLALQLVQYAVTANVFLVGDLRSTCNPSPRPYTLGETLVAAPVPQPAAPPSSPAP